MLHAPTAGGAMRDVLRRIVLLGVCAWIAAMPVAHSAQGATSEGNPVVVFETTMGNITMELWPARAPLTVRDFLALVDDGFYEGLIFHRVIPGFMIQTGGFDRDMAYRKAPRTVPNESVNGLKNSRGTLSMARQADPDSAAAQFFINMNDNTHLDYQSGQPGYTVFGRVIDGYEIAEDIELTDTAVVNGMRDVPTQQVVVIKARRR